MTKKRAPAPKTAKSVTTKTSKKAAPKKAVKAIAKIGNESPKSLLSAAQAIRQPDAIFHEIGRMNSLLSQKMMALPSGRAVLVKEIKKSLKDPKNYTLTAAPFDKKALNQVLETCAYLAKTEKTKKPLLAAAKKEYSDILGQLTATLSGVFVDGIVFYETLEKLQKDLQGLSKKAFVELKKLSEYYCTLEILAHHWTHFMVDAEDLDSFKI